uniref:Uncharacterized protein n=2 Tax=Strongyloides stercoralis TaxID=6248 RepID=A0AAF5D506_STRER
MMGNNLKHKTSNDTTNSKDSQPNIMLERKDGQTGMKKNDFGNKRSTKNINGVFYNAGGTRYYKNRYSYKGSHKQSNGQLNRYNNYQGDFYPGQFNQRNFYNNYNGRSYRNSHLSRNSQSNDMYMNERNPRVRIHSENSHSPRDFNSSLQSNNIQLTNKSDQIQNYKKIEKKDSFSLLPNGNNTNPSTIVKGNVTYTMPEVNNKICICNNTNTKKMFNGDKCRVCEENMGQENKM